MERIKNIHRVTAGPIIFTHDLASNKFLVADTAHSRPGGLAATSIVIDPTAIAAGADAEDFIDMLDDLKEHVLASMRKPRSSDDIAALMNAKNELARELKKPPLSR